MSDLERLRTLANEIEPRRDPVGRGRRPRPLAARILEKIKVDPASGCWLWQGYISKKGYGRVRIGTRVDKSATMKSAHRATYELLVGPIGEGLDLDHLCLTKRCVNPEHLDPVTNAENVERFNVAQCRRGHPRTPENTYLNPAGFRCCKVCRRNADARRGRGRGGDVAA